MNDAWAVKVLQKMKERLATIDPNLDAFPGLQKDIGQQIRALSCAIRSLTQPKRRKRKKSI